MGTRNGLGQGVLHPAAPLHPALRELGGPGQEKFLASTTDLGASAREGITRSHLDKAHPCYSEQNSPFVLDPAANNRDPQSVIKSQNGVGWEAP